MLDLLFHYCSNQTFCSIVQSRAIWLSSLSLSNDTMEGRWLRQIFEAECRAKGVSEHAIPDVMASLDFLIDNTDGFGFCLSEVEDLLSQWRGYADNGGGVSIGFCREYLERSGGVSDDMPGYKLRKIHYGEASGAEHLSSVVDSVKKSAAEGAWRKPSLLFGPTDKEGLAELTKKRVSASFPILFLMFDLFVLKNPAFLEEREWRLLSMSMRHLDEPRFFRARSDAVVPYRNYSIDVDQQPIRKVVLGPRNHSNQRDVANFLSSFGFKDVQVTRSTASYR